MIGKIINILDKKYLLYFLFAVNVIVGIAIAGIASTTNFPDAKGYLLMAEGLLEGRFSSWYFLPQYYPETLRTPGYPFFLAGCKLLSNSELFIIIIQLLLYFLSVVMGLKIIEKINNAFRYRNLFLLLLIPNVQIVYYAGLISTEILNVFFLTWSIYLIFCKRSFSNAILLAITCYFAFIVRPAFLLFPFCIFVYFVLKNRGQLKYHVVFLVVYSILLIPFGLWNLNNHGVFKVTPVEGGAGVAHLGFWQLKLPDGYNEKFYWGNAIVHDYTNPNLYTKDELAENVKEYERECTIILKEIEHYKTKEDSAALNYMNAHNPGIFVLYNSQYTREREKLLLKATVDNIFQNKIFYIKSRLYHLFRTYVTGINYKDFQEAESKVKQIKAIYPFLITFIFIFSGLLFITYNILFKRIIINHAYLLLGLFWYYGIIHSFFAIQARYTIPVHLLVIAILSIAIIMPSEKTKQ